MLPIFSVLDLESFEHDREVEQILGGDSSDSDEDSVAFLPDLAVRDDDSTCSTASVTSISSEEGSHWMFDRSRDERPGPKFSRSRKKLGSKKRNIRRRRRSPKSMCPVGLPDFVDVARTTRTPSPSVLQALHRASEDVRVLGISAIEYYKDLEIQSVHLSKDIPPKGHVDGGALATTTNRLQYIWSYHEFTPSERKKVSRLRVADDTIHVPTGMGFLRVPCRSGSGFIFIKTFFDFGVGQYHPMRQPWLQPDNLPS